MWLIKMSVKVCRHSQEPAQGALIFIGLDLTAIQDFGIAILIGALVGTQREKRRDTEVTIVNVLLKWRL